MSEQLDSLRDANNRLNLEVEGLRRRLEATESHAAEDAAEQANRQKEDFLSRLAHDLRNSLAPVQNAVELLRLPDVNDAQRQRAVDIVDGQVRDLRHVLDELQDVARITRGKVDLKKEPLELAELVGRVVESNRQLMERRKHQLTIALPDEPVWVNVDRVRLTQIVSHLLDNAAKYTDEGGRIHLSVVCGEHQVELRVEDNGIGIDPEELPGVFDLLAKADRPQNHARAGLGIGLTKVRRLVELHGGRVEASSPGRGRGSVFVIRLARFTDVDRLKAASPESIDALLSQPSRRILIVTDNQAFAEEWGLLLRVAGHEVRAVDGAGAALAAARAFQPQAISLDIGAAGLDRDDLVRCLREQPGLEKVIVVGIAENEQEESLRRAAEASCDALLRKPVRIKEFLNLVARGNRG